MAQFRLFLVLLCLAAGCQQPEPSPVPKPELTGAEREARIQALLTPLADRMRAALGPSRVGITAFRKDGEEYEPRVSRYLGPLLQSRLIQEGVSVVERDDLERVMEELTLQTSDLFNEDTCAEVGRLAGVKVLILTTVKDLSLTVYRIELKGVDVETGKILILDRLDVPRELLPIKYGGI
jgi:hypothetical protein